MGTVLLLDSDIIAYKFAAAAEEKIDWQDGDEPMYVQKKNLDEIMDEIRVYIRGIMDKLDATHCIVCLSCSSDTNWRVKVHPEYKANRKGMRKPEQLMDVKAEMARQYSSYQRPHLEADDIMGILSTNPRLLRGDKKIIVSEDKDMQTIPGWLFNPAKDTKPRYITKQEADRYHLYQTLVGDPTDNYKGAWKIGDKKATAILDDDPSWYAVLWTYYCRGQSYEDFLMNAQVARILRAEDYDFKKKEVKLWNPN